MAGVWEQRFAAFIRKVAALRESTALELLPDLMPVLPVLDPAAPELQVLRGERRAAAAWQAVGVAGRLSAVSFVATSNPNVLTVLEGFEVHTATVTDASLTFGMGGAMANAAPLVEYFTDRRQVGTFPNVALPQAAVIAGDYDPAAPNQVFWRQAAGPGSPSRVNCQCILPPGGTIWLFTGNTNVTWAGTAIWRERTVDPAEQTPGY